MKVGPPNWPWAGWTTVIPVFIKPKYLLSTYDFVEASWLSVGSLKLFIL